VAIGGVGGFTLALADPIMIGIVAALVIGKPVGIVATTWLLAKFTKARFDSSVKWIDLLGIGVLAGIGFTVSLLMSELSFGTGSVANDHAKVGILTASLLAALFASVVLRIRNQQYKKIEAEEKIDVNEDGIPDVHQRDV
jgi:NhaA family Na+:H+ antiporter